MNPDSTVVYVMSKLDSYAGILASKIQEIAPVIYQTVRQRVIAESILMIVLPVVIAAIFAPLSVMAYRRGKEDLYAIAGALALVAFVALCIFGSIGILDLMSLDYATVTRIIELAR